MRGFYLHYHNLEDKGLKKTGIDRKVESQIKAINDGGIKCEFLFCKQPESTSDLVKSCLPFFSDGIDWPNPEKLKDVDFLYIRRPRFASKELVAFLSAFRAINSKAKIIYEIPTYPYDAEMSSPKYLPALYKDRINRAMLKEYVDIVADLSGADEIFGIETIRITNGVDLDAVRIRTPTHDGHRVNIMIAASFEPWHGVDRFVRGMADYYASGGQRDLVLHLAGAGTRLASLKKLVEDLSLVDHVIFHGYLSSEELDDLYDMCDLGIECLGIHRRDSSLHSASIKSREYLAKGLPFITSSVIDVFEDEPQDFSKFIEATDSPVSIEEVLDFHDTLYDRETPEELAERMRRFAEETVSMKKAFENVVSFLSDERHEGERVND